MIQTKFLLKSDCYEEYEDGNGALQYYGDRRILDQQFSNLKKYANILDKEFFSEILLSMILENVPKIFKH